jgi:hypothetical protein
VKRITSADYENVLKPKNPERYSGLYEVRGGKVIVPKAERERWRVDKDGDIVGVRKGRRGEAITGILRVLKPGQLPSKPPPGKRLGYAVCLVSRGRRLEWQRFPNHDALQSFIMTYEQAQDWPHYLFEETVTVRRSRKKAVAP